MKVQLKAGKKYSICSCSLSKILPFCDNSHREFNEGNNAEYKSVKIIPESDIKVELNSSLWKSNKIE